MLATLITPRSALGGGGGFSTEPMSTVVWATGFRRDHAWIEVPEYSMLHATIKKDRPAISIRDLE